MQWYEDLLKDTGKYIVLSNPGKMGCTFSGLHALYEAVSGGSEIWVNKRQFKIVRQLGEGGYAFVFLVKEVQHHREGKHAFEASEDGCYALKKVLIQTEDQLDLVKKEIRISSLFKHPNLLPLLEHSIISVKGLEAGKWNQEAYLLFPAYLDGSLQDNLDHMRAKKEFFPTVTVLHIFKQVCDGLKLMHKSSPSYAHNDVKPGNILLSKKNNQLPGAVLMDFGSATPSRRQVRSRLEAISLQEWAAQHCSAPYRAPELWDCPSNADISEMTDIWSLGCTLFTTMYRVSPFEYSIGDGGGSLQLAAMNGVMKWPQDPDPPYPDYLKKFVSWLVEPRVALRPDIDAVIIHVDKLIAKLLPDHQTM